MAPSFNSSVQTCAPCNCLQPGTRDRIRGMFTKSGRYRTLQEEEQDPEGGARNLAQSAAGALPGGGGIELARGAGQRTDEHAAGSSQPRSPHR